MVAPKLYLSTDASAPALTGNVGSFITLLDACLVNGYGARSAAGWTKEFSGTNKAAYRMGAGGTADRMYLRAWDDNAGFGNAAFIQGYRTMTDVDTGVKPFAPFAFVPNINGPQMHKTSANGDVARAWALIASPTAFYLFIETSVVAANLGATVAGVASSYLSGMFFGEYKKNFVGHTMNVAMIGSHIYGTNVSASQVGQAFGKRVNGTNSFPNGFGTGLSHWLARPFAGVDGPTTFAKGALSYWTNSGASQADDWSFGAAGPGANPSVVDAKLRLSKIELIANSPSYEIIGEMPGAYHHIGQFWLPANKVIDGVGTLAGNQYFCGLAGAANVSGSASTAGQMLINLTDW